MRENGRGNCFSRRDGTGAGRGQGRMMRNNQVCQGNGEGFGKGLGRGKANNRRFSSK